MVGASSKTSIFFLYVWWHGGPNNIVSVLLFFCPSSEPQPGRQPQSLNLQMANKAWGIVKQIGRNGLYTTTAPFFLFVCDK